MLKILKLRLADTLKETGEENSNRGYQIFAGKQLLKG